MSRDGPPDWWLTRDGDKTCLALFNKHYSSRDSSLRKIPQFVGPGEKLVLRTAAGDALFAWRKFIDDSGEDGINCAIFRNESDRLSSELIRQADAIADCIWPDQRHYTFINPKAVRSNNPGFCFVMAGWRRLKRRTKAGLIILERLPTQTTKGTDGNDQA